MVEAAEVTLLEFARMQPLSGSDVDITVRASLMFSLAFCLGSVCGLAWLLRSKDLMTRRAICSCLLNGGLCSAVVAMIWLNSYRDNVPALLGVCGAAGLGGQPTVELLVKLFSRVLKKGVETQFHIDLDDSEVAANKDSTDVPQQ